MDSNKTRYIKGYLNQNPRLKQALRVNYQRSGIRAEQILPKQAAFQNWIDFTEVDWDAVQDWINL